MMNRTMNSLIYDKEKGIYLAQNYECKQIVKESNAVKEEKEFIRQVLNCKKGEVHAK